MLRVLLPPNLSAAAPRNAIAIRLELDLAAPPAPALVPALAILQRIGVQPAPVSFVQVTRSQLRELLGALTGQPVLFWANQPAAVLGWNGIELPGVSEHLREPPPPAASQTPSVPRRPSRPARDTPPPERAPMAVDGSEHYLAITLPSRESALYEPALELLRSNRFVLDPLTRKWWLRDRHKVLNLLAAHGRELRERYRAEFTPNFEKNTAGFSDAGIAAAVTEAGEGYEVSLSLEAGGADENRVREAVATGRNYIEHDGRIYLIDSARLDRLAAVQRSLAGDPAAPTSARTRHRIPRSRAAEVSDLLDNLAPHYQAPETWRERSRALHELNSLPLPPLDPAVERLLRPYQKLGVAWLWHLYRQELGGILADEMGLGKTLQALALLDAASRSGAAVGNRRRPHLVVAPASLVENWRRESARFTPCLQTFVHHGADRLERGEFTAFDIVLTSYGTLARDASLFEAVEFDVIVADEAQHLKNRRTQAAQSLRALHGRGRFLLTGTPLENSLDDLRSLFEFLMPGFLNRLPPGLRGEERAWHDERLRTQSAPYILRRTKKAVAPELPEKIEQVIHCEPTSAQSTLYRRLQEDSERELIDLAARGVSENALRLATLTQLLRLRQVCCDPRLVAQGRELQPADSAKLDAFRELLAECIDEGHRMLVFSQFTSLLALLRIELDEQAVPYTYLDGSMAAAARQQQVDRFQRDDSVPVFLISLRAGGTGLNLTGADVVVHYDPWWNPAVEAQATDRAHRIGQTRIVTSYRLICSGTVEEKVLALQDSKRALLADVFEASDAAAARLGLDDLRALLK